jgi:sugar/nucleoside kinase (ribokinase family)
VALVCTLGDAVLDVVVRPDAALVRGDDVTASTAVTPGGQAANVAAWAAALGARVRCVAKRGDDEAGALVAAALSRRGVELVGPVAPGRTGVVVSFVAADGGRTMASDRGTGATFAADELEAGWLHGADWLHVSGYSIGVESDVSERAVELGAGARVSVDLAAVTVIERFGADRFAGRLERLRPDVVFATAAERAALPRNTLSPGRAVWVVKHGPAGIEVGGERFSALEAEVVDTTGAGDALAAGYLVGGVETALAAAARCVATVGAMP